MALEGRAGALSSICSFLRHCPQLATTEDITKRLMGPLDAAITMLTRYFKRSFVKYIVRLTIIIQLVQRFATASQPL